MRFWCYLFGHNWWNVVTFNRGFEEKLTLLQCSRCRLLGTKRYASDAAGEQK